MSKQNEPLVPFGHEFKAKYFSYLDPSVILLNHGSYGTTPSPVIDAQKLAVEEHEIYPCRYEYYDVIDEYKQNLENVCDYLDLDYHNCALVANATTGVNTVLRSIPFDFANDRVLFHSTTYGACANVVKFLHDYYGLKYDVVPINYPCNDDKILADFESFLKEKEYKLCLFDMITSQPGATLPYKELTKLCKKYSTWSLIDGAHAAGQVDLSFINELKPDFLTTNLHKWLSCPKSVGLLYVDPIHHALIQTLPVSHNYSSPYCQLKDGDIEHNRNIMFYKFAFIGTAGYSSYFSVSAAIKFRKEICGGESTIRKYQTDLQALAIPKILESFGKGALLLENDTKTIRCPGLFCVELPIPDEYQGILKKMNDSTEYFSEFKGKCDKISIFEKKCYAPFQVNNNHLFVRFSVQIFNELKDYENGSKIIKEVIFRVLKSEFESQN